MENVFLEPPGQLQKWKKKQLVLWPGFCIRAPESEQYFAVPGQEFLRLLVAVRLQEHIHRIFPDTLHHRKKEDKLKTWKRDCPGQFLCGSKYALSENSKWSGSPNWSISYYFLYKNEPFFSHKGVPPRVMFSPMYFPYKMPKFRCRTGSYLVWIDT